MNYPQFVVTECPRCPDLVLAGVVAGIAFRLDRRTVPPAHAAVVKHYGTPVFVVDRKLTGLRIDFWEPEHNLTVPGRWLAVPHVCHSGHANRPLPGTPRTAPPTPAVAASDVAPY